MKIRHRTKYIAAAGLLYISAAKPSKLPAYNTLLCSRFYMY